MYMYYIVLSLWFIHLPNGSVSIHMPSYLFQKLNQIMFNETRSKNVFNEFLENIAFENAGNSIFSQL